MDVEEAKEDPYVHWDPTNTTYTHLIKAMTEYGDVLDPACTELLQDKEIVSKIVDIPVNKVGSKAVSTLYLRLAVGNPAVMQTYIGTILEALDKKDYDDHKPYLRQFRFILDAEVTSQDQYVKYGMTLYNRMMKANSGFYKATLMGIDYFMRMAAKNKYIKKWAGDNKKELKWIETWLRDNIISGGVYNTVFPKTKMFKGAQMSDYAAQ